MEGSTNFMKFPQILWSSGRPSRIFENKQMVRVVESVSLSRNSSKFGSASKNAQNDTTMVLGKYCTDP